MDCILIRLNFCDASWSKQLNLSSGSYSTPNILLTMIHFNIILQHCPRSSKWSWSFRSFVCFFFHTGVTHHLPIISSSFGRPNNITQRYSCEVSRDTDVCFGEENNFLRLPGFEYRTIHYVAWSLHRLWYCGSYSNVLLYKIIVGLLIRFCSKMFDNKVYDGQQLINTHMKLSKRREAFYIKHAKLSAC
jgi:hypothetical protein